ncbi:hypothetical protein AO1008_09587 [Aspergillus oryzae 100-8]|uniref:DUF7703 domain-containing protein n=1 Tax=Aspergillus oryzae (strain 3.042) TaxID=1160506 RepID=I8TTF3_ASPO3|nr:hypothetical protein Ao3042_06137 [Aspergillus oryzae 3.042]KDE82993.1 hypothetical protein AO1008_09587 [Aspergillus oryzae 100-8]|eukprot:EIT77635.1 hypothetical protein Ao3042_06137 [Aspergillus oryzae 3.042]
MSAVTEPPVFDRETSLAAIPLLAIAAYNSVELFYWIFSFFRRYNGCYFWSLLVTAMGIIIFVTAVVLSLADMGPSALIKIAYSLGFLVMVTGSATVLYARLHLVTMDKTPEHVLCFIIFTTCTLHLPLTILYLVRAFIEFTTRPALESFSRKYEHFVIACSCARELVLSGIYLWVAFRNLKPILDAKGQEGCRVKSELIVMNAFVLASTVCLVVLDHTDHDAIKHGYGSMATSIKLKMEFFRARCISTISQRCTTPPTTIPFESMTWNTLPIPINAYDLPTTNLLVTLPLLSGLSRALLMRSLVTVFFTAVQDIVTLRRVRAEAEGDPLGEEADNLPYVLSGRYRRARHGQFKLAYIIYNELKYLPGLCPVHSYAPCRVML